jgi:uncharacterized sulfatase
LREHGYATGHFGKWHLGGQRDVGDAPRITAYGFDESLTNFEGLGPRLLGLNDAHDGLPARRYALGSDKLGQGPIIWYDRDRLTQGYVGAAIQFAECAHADGRPFYLNVWPDDMHSPFFPPKDRRGSASKRDLYDGVLKTMDEQLGVLFEWVRRSEALRENTLIAMCSDNGPEPGAGSASGFRGSKATLYEGGIRSPLVIWGPGLTAPDRMGAINQESVLMAMDLVPSMLRLARLEPKGPLDGEDLSDTLLGRSARSRSQPLYWRRPPDRKVWPAGSGSVQPDLAMRRGEWKLLCDYDGQRPELYDLQSDLSESKNLATERVKLVETLRASLLEWHRSMPPDNGPTLGEQDQRRSFQPK